MAMTFSVNLVINQGATFRKRFIWEAGSVPAPVDLTGCTAAMQIRSEVDSPDVLASLTTADGGIVLNAEPGSIDLFIDSEDTALFTWEDGVYDIEITFANGDVLRKIRGSVCLSPEVTRV